MTPKAIFEEVWHHHKDLLKIFGAVVLFGGIGFYFVEKDAQDISVEDSFWWSLMTAATVGTADVEPKTWQGKWLLNAPITLASVAFMANLFSRITKHHVEDAFRANRDLLTQAQLTQKQTKQLSSFTL
jgi:voltage-gated potassium channel